MTIRSGSFRRAAILIAIAAVATATGVSAQTLRPAVPETGYVHERWTVEQGLPVNSVNAVLQSRQGYIWAATYDGLVRFDGVRFAVFNASGSEGLPSNRIMSLAEGGDGSLWMITEPGHLVRLHRGVFTAYGSDRGFRTRA